MKKVTTKKDSNTEKREVSVSLMNIETPADFFVALGIGKVNAGIPLEDHEYMAAYIKGVEDCTKITVQIFKKAEPIVIKDDKLFDHISNIVEDAVSPKKKPWYKRFWNRLKYAFNW